MEPNEETAVVVAVSTTNLSTSSGGSTLADGGLQIPDVAASKPRRLSSELAEALAGTLGALACPHV